MQSYVYVSEMQPKQRGKLVTGIDSNWPALSSALGISPKEVRNRAATTFTTVERDYAEELLWGLTRRKEPMESLKNALKACGLGELVRTELGFDEGALAERPKLPELRRDGKFGASNRIRVAHLP